ncbi:hypothetical protein [Ponticoccus alexandrii]|uniref:Uncharacterized protein n=1 Tax=Ponticoccus alexandrii TaxID=1943633 RepID=A0ABX7F8A4_9RHOB|nr:hypothetical protein [Ponticoccus alexandrii]QRF66091.1 hypothetical protein GQA70_07050 [Ponticoccus alexandrii]
MTKRRTAQGCRAGAVLAVTGAAPAWVQGAWPNGREAVREARIASEGFEGIQPGGSPTGDLDQVRGGVGDVNGVAAGRAPRFDVFGLSLMMPDARHVHGTRIEIGKVRIDEGRARMGDGIPTEEHRATT